MLQQACHRVWLLDVVWSECASFSELPECLLAFRAKSAQLQGLGWINKHGWDNETCSCNVADPQGWTSVGWNADKQIVLPWAVTHLGHVHCRMMLCAGQEEVCKEGCKICAAKDAQDEVPAEGGPHR